MKPGAIALIVLILGTILGFAAVAGFLAYVSSTDYFDREGATGMAVIFIFAPLGGLIIGVVAAVVALKVSQRRTP